MKKNRLIIIVFALIILLGLLHQAGTIFYFYWHSFWFDFFMHFLGALSMGFLFLWIWHVSGLFDISTPTKKEAMVGVMIFVLLVSLGWEFFEYAYGIATPVGGDYAIDTLNDLLADVLGGLLAGFIGRTRALYEYVS